MNWTLHHGDCLSVMPTLAADSVDAVITDPPYGLADKWTGGTWFQRGVYGGDVGWDTAIAEKAVNYIIGMGVPTVIWGGNYYALPPSRCWLIWNKINSMRTMADFEMAWTNFDRPSKSYVRLRNGWERSHPTEKPLDLMRWVILNYTNEGDTVLDPFMGSGTTGVACVLEGRRFIGIELERQYYDIAERRISEAAMQQPLFALEGA